MKTDVVFESHFGVYEQLLHNATKDAVDEVADVGLAAAKSAATRGYKVDSILAKIIRTGVERTSKGIGVWLIATDWKSLWFELGTYGRRRRPVSSATRRRRSSASGQARRAHWGGNPGVFPLYYLVHGADAARARLPEALERMYDRIRL